jgi:hypothetical protein
LVVDFLARFVPRAIGTGTRPDAETIEGWLNE